MRIALISDIHGNLPALEAVVKDIARRGADTIINLGDSLSGPLMPLETAQFLMAQNWTHLAGNHERQLLATAPHGVSDAFALSQLGQPELLWIGTLQNTLQYHSDILLCHGTPASDTAYFLETVTPDGLRSASENEIRQRLGAVESRLIACGHTHLPKMVRTARDQLIINPGSVGLPAYSDNHPYPHQVENGSPDARYAMVEYHQQRWQGTLIAVPYHYKRMVKLAQARHRPDWEKALLSGYI